MWCGYSLDQNLSLFRDESGQEDGSAMLNQKPGAANEDLRAAYAALADYHTSLVQTRFTIVGLFLAANGFLAIGFFQSGAPALARIALPVIAIVLAVICWVLEVRTYHLLENLAVRGLDLEKQLGYREYQGFFSLIAYQPIGLRLIPTRFRLPAIKGDPILSHTLGISLIYIIIGLFWLIMLFLGA